MDKQGENEKLDKKALKRQALDAYRLKNTLRPCNIDLLFKIPQVLCVKSVTKRSFNTKNDITVEYNICDGGVMGSKETNFVGKYHCKEGTSRLIILCKVVPEGFDSSANSQDQLYDPAGSCHKITYSQQVDTDSSNLDIGTFTFVIHEGEDNASGLKNEESNQDLCLVYQGSTKNIEGLTCIQARFAYPGLSNTQVPVNPQDIYHVTKTSGSFVILNPLVSPFPEDDNLVRVVVIPDSEKGCFLKSGDVIANVNLVKKDDIESLSDKCDSINKMLKEAWTVQPPTFMSKKIFDNELKKSEATMAHLRKEREEEWTVRSEVLLQQYLDEQRKRDEKIKRKEANRKREEECKALSAWRKANGTDKKKEYHKKRKERRQKEREEAAKAQGGATQPTQQGGQNQAGQGGQNFNATVRGRDGSYGGMSGNIAENPLTKRSYNEINTHNMQMGNKFQRGNGSQGRGFVAGSGHGSRGRGYGASYGQGHQDHWYGADYGQSWYGSY